MIRDVLVVCVGNICRSPIAECLFKVYINDSQKIHIHSAGLHALVDSPCDPMAQDIMKQHGYDLSSHRARQLKSDLLQSSELILTMTDQQQKDVEDMYPFMRGRVHRIGKWSGFDVVDPYQRPRVIFEQAYALINQGVKDWCQQLWI